MSSLSVLLRHKSLNYGNFSLELHDVPIFRWESDISGTLSLYSADTCLKLERSALEIHILYCRTDVCSWNLPVEVSFMLDDSFSVPFLCNHCVKVSKYRVYSGPYFSVFGLNTEIYVVNLRIQSNTGKYGPEKTPYLDTFHAVNLKHISLYFIQDNMQITSK